MVLSIITINYNNAQGLKQTINSVVGQTFKDYEYIVIDGGSTDDSVNVIRQQQHISYWISEPDGGIYNAMNKGLLKAKGDYVLMLNSGDYLIDNYILEKIFENIKLRDIVYGNILWTDTLRNYEESYPEKLTFQYFRTNSIGHQAAFVRKRVHDIVGLYDERYKIVSDWKFFLLAICKYNFAYQYLPVAVSVCDRSGLSCLPENAGKIIAEKSEILLSEFPSFIDDYNDMDRTKSEFLNLKNNTLFKIKNKLKGFIKRN